MMFLSDVPSHLPDLFPQCPAFCINVTLVNFCFHVFEVFDFSPTLVHNVGGDVGRGRGDYTHCLGKGIGGGDQLATAGQT